MPNFARSFPMVLISTSEYQRLFFCSRSLRDATLSLLPTYLPIHSTIVMDFTIAPRVGDLYLHGSVGNHSTLV